MNKKILFSNFLAIVILIAAITISLLLGLHMLSNNNDQAESPVEPASVISQSADALPENWQTLDRNDRLELWQSLTKTEQSELWQELSTSERIAFNPSNCDVNIQYIWDSDGSCRNKPDIDQIAVAQPDSESDSVIPQPGVGVPEKQPDEKPVSVVSQPEAVVSENQQTSDNSYRVGTPFRYKVKDGLEVRVRSKLICNQASWRAYRHLLSNGRLPQKVERSLGLSRSSTIDLDSIYSCRPYVSFINIGQDYVYKSTGCRLLVHKPFYPRISLIWDDGRQVDDDRMWNIKHPRPVNCRAEHMEEVEKTFASFGRLTAGFRQLGEWLVHDHEHEDLQILLEIDLLTPGSPELTIEP